MRVGGGFYPLLPASGWGAVGGTPRHAGFLPPWLPACRARGGCSRACWRSSACFAPLAGPSAKSWEGPSPGREQQGREPDNRRASAMATAQLESNAFDITVVMYLAVASARKSQGPHLRDRRPQQRPRLLRVPVRINSKNVPEGGFRGRGGSNCVSATVASWLISSSLR